jgi:hypothetical protein
MLGAMNRAEAREGGQDEGLGRDESRRHKRPRVQQQLVLAEAQGLEAGEDFLGEVGEFVEVVDEV